jgi:hypothetical protein
MRRGAMHKPLEAYLMFRFGARGIGHASAGAREPANACVGYAR